MDAVPFRKKMLVRFAHCDPAGIVFYPRFLEMFNELVEDWFAEALLFSFRDLHGLGVAGGRKLGIPTVRLEVDFKAPSSIGDVLDAELVVREIRNTSLTLMIDLRGDDGRPRVSGRVVLVFLDLETRRPIAVPQALRSRMEAFRIVEPEV